MESTDEQIIGLLSRDGRMSYTDLGKATGLSTSAAQQRVRRLEQRGVIQGYKAVIDPEALGKLLTGFVSVRLRDDAGEDDLPERIADLPEVVSCYSMAGLASYLLKVQVESPADLERVLKEIRHRVPVATETQLVLSVPYADRPLV
ncbi:MAG TPA: Lrp/AsnC family transcriptional regulator [Propioniciclava sp.]|uniref:Lrp/AsnC family transcriptional regulator n=1 Tax=Propioniciclava sp. TaxID=2038686 RepID=UPI002B758C82|nr:Lrp/AsnC family transcriptional regulator [Propioniciclava sp.]HRL48072.1 Lrp/AsnC family transcriptional regulator [Propioniciclava sp.]HRL80628.1 Lrp/AsnC family transcriptional regulator [Propioniciclava sp.]